MASGTTLTPEFTLIFGAMFSGKSEELLRRIHRFRVLGKNVLAVNHSWDTRYGPSDEINTHSDHKLDGCIGMNRLQDLFFWCEEYNKADVIAIDELQFFNDATDFIKIAVEEHGKVVIAAGLSGSFERRAFGQISQLIPMADQIIFLRSLCKLCGDGTPAPFTKKLLKTNKEVGGDELYEAVCRKHFKTPE